EVGLTEEQLPEPSAKEAADDTDDDRANQAARGSPRHEVPGDRARDQSNDDPAENTKIHNSPLRTWNVPGCMLLPLDCPPAVLPDTWAIVVPPLRKSGMREQAKYRVPSLVEPCCRTLLRKEGEVRGCRGPI